MNLLRKVIGPKSKYDNSIAYAYMAKVYSIEGDEELCQYYYGDTICSLIEFLDKHDYSPEEVKLFGLFKGEEIEIDLRYCTNDLGNWLMKPDLCRSLERAYKETLQKIYKGHVDIDECEFEDREEIII